MPPTERVWVGDVLVVGAGVSGVLTARALAAKGYQVTIVEAVGFGAGQSGHSHGYLHKGHIYVAPEPELVAELSRGAQAWEDEFRRLGLAPTASAARVGFVNPLTARSAESRWRRCGLPVEETETPSGFTAGSFVAWYATKESTIDATDWFEAVVQDGLGDVRTIRGTVTRLLRDGRHVLGAEVAGRQGPVELHAGMTVVTAGTGNYELVQSAAGHRGRAINRTSYMLVLSGADLPQTSAIVPDHEAYGLFLASRANADGGASWLVSNYVSYAGGLNSPRAAALWARATTRTLNSLTSVLDIDNLRWGIYPATKGEVRYDRTILNAHVVDDSGLRRFFVGSPTKLTLAPLLAERVVAAVERETPNARPRSTNDLTTSDVLPIAKERWLTISRRPLRELLELLRDPRAEPAAFT